MNDHYYYRTNSYLCKFERVTNIRGINVLVKIEFVLKTKLNLGILLILGTFWVSTHIAFVGPLNYHERHTINYLTNIYFISNLYT